MKQNMLVNLIFSVGLFFSMTSSAESQKSIIMMVKKNSQVAVLDYGKVLIGALIPGLKATQQNIFKDMEINLYQEQSSSDLNKVITELGNQPRTYLGLKALMESRGLPAPSPFAEQATPAVDLILQIKLQGDLQEPQSQWLLKMAGIFSKIATVDLFVSNDYSFIDRQTNTDTDEYMAFIVPWKGGLDQEKSLAYWKNIHGPLATKLINDHRDPSVIKNYVQYQTEISQPGGFNSRLQGICIERVSSVLNLAREALTDPKTTISSQELAIDEYSFSEGPSMLFLKKILF